MEMDAIAGGGRHESPEPRWNSFLTYEHPFSNDLSFLSVNTTEIKKKCSFSNSST